MIVVKQSGGFNNLEKFLAKAKLMPIDKILDRYAKQGLRALQSATPVDTGKTAASWGYEIEKRQNGYTIAWTNSNIVDGVPIAIVLQYGHATGNGGYVEGVDYINPALKDVFEKMADGAWKEVTSK